MSHLCDATHSCLTSLLGGNRQGSDRRISSLAAHRSRCFSSSALLISPGLAARVPDRAIFRISSGTLPPRVIAPLRRVAPSASWPAPRIPPRSGLFNASSGASTSAGQAALRASAVPVSLPSGRYRRQGNHAPRQRGPQLAAFLGRRLACPSGNNPQYFRLTPP